MVQCEARPAIHVEKQLGLAHNLGKAESLGISNSDQIVLATPACQLCGSVGGVFRKGTMACAHLDSRHFSFSQYATGVF